MNEKRKIIQINAKNQINHPFNKSQQSFIKQKKKEERRKTMETRSRGELSSLYKQKNDENIHVLAPMSRVR